MSQKISPSDFFDQLGAYDIDLFTGVPDSLLQDFAAYVEVACPPERHIITANEGNAVALAGGYHVATGRFAAVYLQNSGLGNMVNPLLSLADDAVYGLPMLLIVGWRGEPGVKDEPQHVTQGRLNNVLLETLGIEYAVLKPASWREQVGWATSRLRETSKPVAVVVRKGLFDKFASAERATDLLLTREVALESIIDSIDRSDFVVSTTGKTSREVFEIRERRGEDHAHDFLTVGGMGHTSSIALGMSLGTDRLVYCIDGDGSLLMHLGGVVIAAQQRRPNLRYVLINNGAHESVGGQPTVAFDVDLPGLLSAAGFDSVETVREQGDVAAAMRRLSSTPHAALIVEVSQGSRADLGRPTRSPRENKLDMMRQFGVKLAR